MLRQILLKIREIPFIKAKNTRWCGEPQIAPEVIFEVILYKTTYFFRTTWLTRRKRRRRPPPRWLSNRRSTFSMTRFSIENLWPGIQMKIHGKVVNWKSTVRYSIENPWSGIQFKSMARTYHLYKLPMSNQYFWKTYTSKLMTSFFQVAALTVRFGRLTEEYQGFKVKGCM